MKFLLTLILVGCATAGTPEPCSPATLAAIEGETLVKYLNQCDGYADLMYCPAAPAIKQWRTETEKEAGCR